MHRSNFFILGSKLQIVLVASLALVAALTVGLNTVVVSRVISDYLRSAESDQVARDMNLASSFYKLKLDETAAISQRLVLDPGILQNLQAAARGQEEAIKLIEERITTKITVLALGGTHLIAVLDVNGNLLVGQILAPDGSISSIYMKEGWGDIPIVKNTFRSDKPQAATEVIEERYLADIGMNQQARIDLIETPKAAANPFDLREGTGGFALVGVYPYHDEQGVVMGAVLTAYMFNNDFTLVDRIKEVAGVDTVTIFFGDLRVSTNVMTDDGKRAVGTRVSQEVYDVVLDHGEDYVGEAFVVNDVYITRYHPLWDHRGNVVGILYVGALKSSFQTLVDTFNTRVIMIALVCIILASVIAIPIASTITKPIKTLVDANQRLAQGDMTVQVTPYGSGELGLLGRAFNAMVSTLQKTQQDLLHKEKLASMGQLAAGVAHEINNPLGTILLFADVLYNEMPDSDTRRSDLKMIIDETTRCKVIVADLLNFARQQEVLAENTDIHKLLEEVIEGFSLRASMQNVEFKCEYSSDALEIQADPAQLKQVFINLFVNAADAMDGGGTITLTTTKVDERWIEIKVTDNGCGIPEENLRKLFTPFFTTKEAGKGTGLGLSIAYGIIKMHQGQINVESEVGKGTEFTILLPTKLPNQMAGYHNVSGDGTTIG